MDFLTGDSVTGPWDIRGRFDQYIGHYSVHNKTVLDVGTASGFLAFSAESAGARVTALDLEHVREINLLPFKAHTYYSGDRITWEAETQENWQRKKKGFWYAWHRNRSNVEVIYAPLEHLRYVHREFDVVFAGAILEHLGDPISAIGLIGRIAKEAVIIAFTPVEDTDELLMRPITDLSDPNHYFTWWSLSRGLYRRVFHNIGFEIEIVPSRALDTATGADVERKTIIAKRVSDVRNSLEPLPHPLQQRLDKAVAQRDAAFLERDKTSVLRAPAELEAHTLDLTKQSSETYALSLKKYAGDLEEEVERLRRETAQLRSELEAATRRRIEIEGSTSWRATRPMRELVDLMRRHRH
jgi:hypothetical protein